MSFIYAKLVEGGILFMGTIMILLFIILGLTVIAVLQVQKEGALAKWIKLINGLGLFTLVFGILGQLIGLQSAFVFIEQQGQISPSMLAGGLKVSMLTTMFGAIVFLISRLITLVLQGVSKEKVTA